MNTFSIEHSLISNYKNSLYEIISNIMISYNDNNKIYILNPFKFLILFIHIILQLILILIFI